MEVSADVTFKTTIFERSIYFSRSICSIIAVSSSAMGDEQVFVEGFII